MKLSVWSSYYVDLTPEDALRELKAHGYSYCELSDEHALVLMERGEPAEVGKEFGKFARELGVELLQGHLFLNAKICKDEDRALLKSSSTYSMPSVLRTPFCIAIIFREWKMTPA